VTGQRSHSLQGGRRFQVLYIHVTLEVATISDQRRVKEESRELETAPFDNSSLYSVTWHEGRITDSVKGDEQVVKACLLSFCNMELS